MRVYLFQIAKLFLLFYAIFLMNCSDNEFCNPLDPVPGDCKLRLIDNFDDGKDPNLLCYVPEFFYNKQKIETHYESNRLNVLHSKGFSMCIQFDVTENKSFQGWIQVLGTAPDGGFDASKFKYLTLWIKTDPENIECDFAIKDTEQNSMGNYQHETAPKVSLLEEVEAYQPSKEWKNIRIPLLRLVEVDTSNTIVESPIDLKNLYQLIFGFSYKETYPNSGCIYIDDIAFEK